MITVVLRREWLKRAEDIARARQARAERPGLSMRAGERSLEKDRVGAYGECGFAQWAGLSLGDDFGVGNYDVRARAGHPWWPIFRHERHPEAALILAYSFPDAGRVILVAGFTSTASAQAVAREGGISLSDGGDGWQLALHMLPRNTLLDGALTPEMLGAMRVPA